MAKRANTIVNRAAAFLAEKGEVTPTELNDYLAVGNYASKYVLYMKIAGHGVNTVKNGRTVVKYVYVSSPDVPAVKPVVVEDDKPVMDHGRKFRKTVDDVEGTFGSSGGIGSYSVDRDWDEVPSDLNLRELGV